MLDALELSILDSHSNDHAIAMGRRGSDVAIGRLPFGAELDGLADFQTRLTAVLRGKGPAKKPQPADLEKFGRGLFDFVMRDDLRALYDRLPETHVSVNILSNEPKLRQLPWEYLQEPKRLSPRNGRCVVRVIPTIGLQPPDPLPASSITKVLFVSADPIGLADVSWNEVQDVLRRAYEARLGKLKLELIEGTDRDSLVEALLSREFDIVHFSCHGEVADGEGRLILVNRKTKGPDYITSRELGRVVAGRGIRLVILSACETASGNPDDDFGSIAETLVRQGIPAVVANQAPVANKTVAVFVGALYRELLKTGNIDKAVTAGRIALSLDLRDSPEWGIPTLYRLYGAEQLYDEKEKG